MGVDQYTSVHRFDAIADGGRIELRRDRDDSVGVATVRAHLRSIAHAFAAGDFTAPAAVHLRRYQVSPRCGHGARRSTTP